VTVDMGHEKGDYVVDILPDGDGTPGRRRGGSGPGRLVVALAVLCALLLAAVPVAYRLGGANARRAALTERAAANRRVALAQAGESDPSSGRGDGSSASGLTFDLSKAAYRPPDASLIPEGAVVSVKDGSILVPIPAGKAVFGASNRDKGAQYDEKPRFRATLPGYYIGLFEVTNAQFSRFVDETQTSASSLWIGGTIPTGQENHPVASVSWSDADAYCEWAGLRLPSELEWEKAARGTDGRAYPWGSQPDRTLCRNMGNCGAERTARVGSYPSGKSPYGILDMAGNVWEWCADWYSSDAYERYAKGDLDPPTSGTYRVLRGGCWVCSMVSCRSTLRVSGNPSNGGSGVGLRVARALE